MKRISIVISCALILAAAVACIFYFGSAAGSRGGAAPIHEAEDHRKDDLQQPLIHAGDAGKEHESEAHVLLTDAQIKTLGISVAKAGPGMVQIPLRLQGEILLNAEAVAHVTPYVSGHVKRILKNLGDPVRKGEVMAVLESRELADAKAAYFAALEKVILAETRFTREEKLWKKQISSEEDYLDARQDLAAAEIEKRSAKQQLMAIGLSKTSIQQLPKNSDDSLTRYEIVSPLKGQVLEKNLTLGEMVERDRIVYRVADMDSVWVRVHVYQKDLPFLKKNMKVLISADGDREEAEGILSHISPVVDEGTRTATALLTLHNQGGNWRPGRFVKAGIPSKTEELPVVVPKEAVQSITDQQVVFVPAEEGFEARPISTGRSDSKHVEVISGLSAGDAYVVEGAFEIKAAILAETLGDHAGHGH